MANRKDNSITGAAGVFYAASILSLRGMIALPTIKNVAAYDILVSSSDGERHANIQVKASGECVTFWPISKLEKVKSGIGDFYVLLRCVEKEKFEGFMLTGAEMKTELEAYRDWYLAKGKPKSVENFPLCLGIEDEAKRKRWKHEWENWTLQKSDGATA